MGLVLHRFCALFVLLMLVCGTGMADQQQLRKGSASQNRWVAETSECHETIMRYLEWHSMALAIGSHTEEIEHQWLVEGGLSNKDTISELYRQFIQLEQNIESLDSMLVNCAGNPNSVGYKGRIIINSTLLDGQKMRHVFTMIGPDSYLLGQDDLNASIADDMFESLAQTYLLQLPFLKESYQQRVRQLGDGTPTNLKFTDEEVDMWFAWPAGKLMTAAEETSTEITKHGETEKKGRKKTYITALTQSDYGVRLSSRYSGKPVYTPALSEADLKKGRQNWIDKCVEDFRFCGQQFAPNSVPYHYSRDSKGKRSRVILDEDYTAELKEWMEDTYSSDDKYNEFVSLMIEDVQSKSEDQNFVPRFVPLEGNLRQFHSEKLVKGEIYTKFGFPVKFSRVRYFQPDFRHDQVSMELQYLGKAQCHSEDTSKSCAHLAFRMKNLELIDSPLHKNTSVEVSVDILVEPHSLLIHKVDYDGLSTTFASKELTTIAQKRHGVIDIEYSYEDLLD